MNKFLITVSKYTVTTSVALAIALSPLAQLASVAQADTFNTNVSGTYTAPTTGVSSAAATQTTNTSANTQFNTSGTSYAAPTTGTTLPTTAATAGTQAPSNTSDQMCVGGIGGCLANIIYVFTVGIGSAFAYVAATFFNIAVNISLNGPIYALTFVSTGWTTARDLANMAFLFILIYIAFIIMFQAETSGTMSLLAGVVVVALLVNFSFFFTRLVIDMGNILSIQFYNSIQAPAIQNTASSGGASGIGASLSTTATNATAGITGTNTKDLTASIMGMLNMQGLLNNTSFQNFNQTQGWLTKFITLSFLYLAGGIILWLLTVIFVTAGIKFLTRIVMLWFLIIVSPLAFIAASVQGVNKGYFKTWRETLVAHAFYPVAFMFIFLILTNFCNQLSQGGQNNYISNLFNGLTVNPGGGVAAIAITITQAAISLGFIIVILYMGLKVSDKISVVGASFAEKAGNWAGGAFKASTLGLAARTGGIAFRETIGRQAQNDIDSMKKNPPRGVVGQYMDYALRKSVLTPLANASIGGAKSYTGITASRKEVREDWNKNKDETLTNIKNREDAKKLAEVNEQWDPLAKQLAPLEEEIKKLKSQPLTTTTGVELLNKEEKIADLKAKMDPLRPQREQLISNMEKMEGPQVTALAGKDLEKIIKHISDKQIKAIKESLKYNKTEKDTLERKWHETSGKAPLAESQEQLKKLGDLHQQLQVLHVDLKTLGSAVKPNHGETVNINLGVTKKMKKELEDELDKQENKRDNRDLDSEPDGKKQRTEAGIAVKRLKTAIEKVTKLEEQVKNIPKNVGGTGNEGEFKVEGK